MSTAPNRIVTDSLGFRLEVTIEFGAYPHRGRHVTFETDAGEVTADSTHRIEVNESLVGPELAEVISHECYHLFYSVRKLITVDEETEAIVFGQLVKHVHSLR